MVFFFYKNILTVSHFTSQKDEFQEPYHLAPHSMVCKFISTVQIFNFWLYSP